MKTLYTKISIIFSLTILTLIGCKKTDNSSASTSTGAESMVTFTIDGANYTLSDASRIKVSYVDIEVLPGKQIDIPPKSKVIGIRVYSKNNKEFADIRCLNMLGSQKCKLNVLMDLFPDTTSTTGSLYSTALSDSNQNMVSVTTIDTNTKTISGTFKLKALLTKGGGYDSTNFKAITKGVFKNIHY